MTPPSDVDVLGLPTAGQRTEVEHRPVEANLPQRAIDRSGRLPKSPAEHDLCRQVGLDGGITIGLRAAMPAWRCGAPLRLRVEPDHQRAAALERLAIADLFPVF